MLGNEELAGAWRRSVVVTSDSCGTGLARPTGEGILRVSHLDSSLTIDYYNTCGTLISADVPGSFTDPLVMVTRSLVACIGNPFEIRCCYDVAETDTGTLQGDGIVGETVVFYSINPSLSYGGCNLSYTCEIRGTLEWQRCPPVDCSFQNCATTSGSSP
jgi:hypothetical protein